MGFTTGGLGSDPGDSASAPPAAQLRVKSRAPTSFLAGNIVSKGRPSRLSAGELQLRKSQARTKRGNWHATTCEWPGRDKLFVGAAMATSPP